MEMSFNYHMIISGYHPDLVSASATVLLGGFCDFIILAFLKKLISCQFTLSQLCSVYFVYPCRVEQVNKPCLFLIISQSD